MFCNFCGESLTHGKSICAQCGQKNRLHKSTGLTLEALLALSAPQPAPGSAGRALPPAEDFPEDPYTGEYEDTQWAEYQPDNRRSRARDVAMILIGVLVVVIALLVGLWFSQRRQAADLPAVTTAQTPPAQTQQVQTLPETAAHTVPVATIVQTQPPSAAVQRTQMNLIYVTKQAPEEMSHLEEIERARILEQELLAIEQAAAEGFTETVGVEMISEPAVPDGILYRTAIHTGQQRDLFRPTELTGALLCDSIPFGYTASAPLAHRTAPAQLQLSGGDVRVTLDKIADGTTDRTACYSGADRDMTAVLLFPDAMGHSFLMGFYENSGDPQTAKEYYLYGAADGTLYEIVAEIK